MTRHAVWKRLTHSGQRSREQMPAEDQMEYDRWGFRPVESLAFRPTSDEERAEAKRLYEGLPAVLDDLPELPELDPNDPASEEEAGRRYGEWRRTIERVRTTAASGEEIQ